MQRVTTIILLAILMSATGCVGNPITSRKHQLMDAEYFYLTQEQFDHQLGHAVQKMKDDGWNKYQDEILDCEDYAFKMVSEIKYSYTQHFAPKGRGIRVGVASYLVDDEDKNGDGVINVEDGDIDHGWHMCVVVDIFIDDDTPSVRKYYEPYPWAKQVPIEMSKAELKSIRRSIM
jgi:hypothetical protein